VDELHPKACFDISDTEHTGSMGTNSFMPVNNNNNNNRKHVYLTKFTELNNVFYEQFTETGLKYSSLSGGQYSY
jgi:hypothetical protein